MVNSSKDAYFCIVFHLTPMEFRTKADISICKYRLQHSDKLLVMGSCFADHIGERLKQMKFRTIVNPYGVLYNPLSIAEGLTRLIEYRPFTEGEMHEFPDGGWNTWLHHSRYSHPDKHTALTSINESIEQSSKLLAEANVLIITFGTAWVYHLNDTNRIVGNCHKIPERNFSRQRLHVQEIIDTYSTLMHYIEKINPRLRILFTVSPIRHLKDGLHGNQLSKSTLLLAIDELCRMYPEKCYYFPAYEIVMDELRDYRFYAEDMAHPSQQAIEYVWLCFVEHCIDTEAQCFMQQWEKVIRALEHRPFRPASEQYQSFILQNLKKIAELKALYPYLDVQEEIERCHSLKKIPT